MEKLTYLPLIAHLKEKADFYNQLYRNNQVKYGQIDPALISSWMVQSIEPIIEKVDSVQPQALPHVFEALYTELLEILGNKSAVVNRDRYLSAWLICLRMPKIVATFPVRVIKSIDSALKEILIYKPESAASWTVNFGKIAYYISSIDEFLSVGRIVAWTAGLAHLRGRAINEHSLLRDDLKQAIRKTTGIDVAPHFSHPWFYFNNAFVRAVGGFIGFGGNFVSAPKVAKVGEAILVADQKHSYALFADSFGTVLLPEIPILPETVIQYATLENYDKNVRRNWSELIPFEDITSFVIENYTLVLTRSSSHHIYIYSLTK